MVFSAKDGAVQVNKEKNSNTSIHQQQSQSQSTMSLLVQSIDLLPSTPHSKSTLTGSAPPFIPALANAPVVSTRAKRSTAQPKTWSFQLCRATRPLSTKENADFCVLPRDPKSTTTTLDEPRMLVEDDDSNTLIISDELIQDILMQCDGPTLNAIASTCHHLRRLLRDAYWWKQKALAHCGSVVGEHFFRNSSVPFATPNFHRVAFWHSTRFAHPYSMYEASFRLESAALHCKINPATCHMQTYRFPISKTETGKLVGTFWQNGKFSNHIRSARVQFIGDEAPSTMMLIREENVGEDNVLHLLQVKSGYTERYSIMLQATKYAVAVAVTRSSTPQCAHGQFVNADRLCAYLRENHW
jgi:hypothetical protein